MSSNKHDGAANTPAASQIASGADATTGTAAAVGEPEVNTQVPECKNEVHVKILEKLMRLYFGYTLQQAEYTRWLDNWANSGPPDANDVWCAYREMDGLLEKIETICRMAKKANPELRMVRQYYREEAESESGEDDWDEEDDEDEEPEVVQEEIN